MNDLQVVIGLLCLGVMLNIYTFIKDWRKGKLLYALKEIINGWSFFVWIVIALYIIIGSATLLPMIQEWSLTLGSPESSPLAIWLLHTGYSLAWVFCTILLVIWLLGKFKQPLRYNDKEKEWERESQIKFRNKLPKMLKWMAGKQSNDNLDKK